MLLEHFDTNRHQYKENRILNVRLLCSCFKKSFKATVDKLLAFYSASIVESLVFPHFVVLFFLIQILSNFKFIVPNMKTIKQIKKKVLGIKEVRVNLFRLTKEKIDRMMNVPAKESAINYNFSLKFTNNKWKCTDHPTSIVPIISNGGKIFISLKQSNALAGQSDISVSSASDAPAPERYCLRLRAKKNHPKTSH